MAKSLLLVGVGGQGTILVSKILSEGLLEEGYDVKMSEIHGMAQRGGSVTTQIRFGDKVYSPTINKGEADVLVSFEKLEGARYVSQLKKDGTLIVNEEEMWPLPVLAGLEKYPENIMEELKSKIDNVISINARDIAEELGEPRCQNIVMLGLIVKALGLENIDWKQKIKKFLPERVHEVNLKAFERGLN
ncbi:indolepyruvate oxidoreductase subunit beta [Tissierella sp. MB52-C2]|uniref:indolepyruvate oxidoreductase subunit beta n=1 Tax=Tissierella sp. MB52-C2 TaxID=3070999 RepID=UPI00280B17B8|nr:indolepyruvate oxidoreductase subunit beta [Tissierella sp. MB52-C2]WMM24609.1 indolepyruvate oxidoreductase subunit beta [Tissierella sp. MB52-C2]